ncbi:MAG: hypothetical protein GY757_51260 [bacterium]|nr:hypothetical protein [bacterium]
MAKKRQQFESIKAANENVELLSMRIQNKIEHLKTQFNLYFAGELRVPPEQEREAVEKMVRDLLYSHYKSPKSQLLIQNITQKFSLYNNMWKKKLNDIETGNTPLQKQRVAYMQQQDELKKEKKKPKKKKLKETTMNVSLNSEESFENFYNSYAKILKKDSVTEAQKDNVINSIKMKLITQNLVDAKISLHVKDGKLKMRIKNE